jgi:hypothetical protein
MARLGDLLIDMGLRGRLVRAGVLKPVCGEPDDHQQNPEEVPLPQAASGRTMVALLAGQSNAANAGTDPMDAVPGVYNLYRGRCYVARDPLLGASGQGGSVWLRFGRRVLESGLYQTVILVPVAIGGTRIAHWTPGGELCRRIPDAIRQTHALGLRFTHVFWHQGESDAQYGTAQAVYERSLRAIIGQVRHAGVDAPMIVCRAARLRDIDGPQIIAAQNAVISSTANVFPGPDTDADLGGDMRFDGLHLNARGFEAFAQGLLAALPEKLAPVQT